jgi:pyruvate-ferredoxin/flavodoxin oxidoreductase
MSGLRNVAIHWYRKVFGAPAGSDIREEGLDTVLDGNTAVALSESAIGSHRVRGAEGPRGTVAAATGLALAGRRATAFLTGTDIAATQDLLSSAAGKHAPLVLHLSTRAMAAHGATLGSGHESVHLSADSGFFMLFAANVQEAVDFTHIARRVAEESLVPGMVIMDSEQTALAPQNARLLSPAQVSGLLGSARERVESPTAAQKLLFGETRRRVPTWHDLDEPALTGALFDKGSFALGALARGPFFDAFVQESLRDSFETFARKAGRQYESISSYRMDNARTVLLAQGSAIETARVAADVLRDRYKVKVGVLGVHVLRPFPAAAIGAALSGCSQVIVLERMNSPLSSEPPLSREIRSAFDYLADKQRPTFATAIYGVGGLPLRVSDLVELGTRGGSWPTTPVCLGVAFDDMSAEQPKREVMLDALRRAYPDVAQRGIRAAAHPATSLQKGALTIAIQRTTDRDEAGMLETVGSVLQQLEDGRIRSRPAVSWDHWSETRVDWLTHGDDALQDPGDELSADITLITRRNEVLLDKKSKTFGIPVEPGSADAAEIRLGGLLGAMQVAGLIDHKPRRIIAARKALLEGVASGRSDKIMTAFQAGLEQVTEIEAEASVETQGETPWEGEAPAAVRHLARDDDHFASLPRFWDQAGVLYRNDQADRLTADPFLATGTMPPLSSTFHDTSGNRSKLPAFDPALCTGCGQCWTHCPDSAIGVVASKPAALIDAGINRCGADAVRQVSGKLAARMISSSRKAEDAAPTFGEMLDAAYAWLKDKMPLPDDRKQAIEDGIDSIRTALGALPVAVTKPFFHDAEAKKKDSAELLSIVINPEACKSCGLCVSNCEPEALRGTAQDAALLANAHKLWSIFSTTPDTASETLERVMEDPDIGAMAAILLSRYCQFAMPGGDPAEAGSGEKIAVRLALSATEFHQQPIVQQFAETLAEAGESLASLINETLSATLAIEDLDAVTEKLKNASSPRVDLQDLADSIGDAADDHSIDTDYLLRLIELSDRIQSAHHQLVAGEHGLGRARYGLAVAGGSAAEWAGAFPYNPFQAPVLIDMSGDAAQLSAGLIEGHLEETTDLIRLLQLAQIEVDQPDGADWKRAATASLRWQDLSREELALCPPLILIGSDEMLAGRGLSQLIWLLNSGLPVKVLVLSALDFGLTVPNDPRGNLGMLALAQRKAYVAQTSVADSQHLGVSMLRALAHEGPALVQVYAPSPGRHGFLPRQTLAQAQLAINCHALPLFRYDPHADGVFGSRITLGGNPEDRENGVTLADWAFGQERFAANFEALADDAAAPMTLHDWLQLDAKGRKGKTPYITTTDEDEERRLAVSPALAAAADECRGNWQTLQELAGIVTPFTERLEEEIRTDLTAEHQADLDAQKKAFETEIKQIQEKTQAEIASKIRSRLLQLASQKRN